MQVLNGSVFLLFLNAESGMNTYSGVILQRATPILPIAILKRLNTMNKRLLRIVLFHGRGLVPLHVEQR
jgi:hypothetical protein